jgi:hypothetical protein
VEGLDLVPIEELWAEIKKRVEGAVLVYDRPAKSKGQNETMVLFHGSSIAHCHGLSLHASRRLEQWDDEGVFVVEEGE